MIARAMALSLPTADLDGLRRRVRPAAEPRAGISRMLDAAGRVLYVGKARQLRSRLLSYFHAKYPDDKAARILHAASDVTWEYVSSEFAAHLAELREIRKCRPPYNVQMNRTRSAVFIGVAEGPAPKLSCTGTPSKQQVRYYGPLPSSARSAIAIRVLNDLLGLRDCADRMPMAFAEQGDLFDTPRQAACPRYDFGTCSGPCAGLVTEPDYRQRVATATAFLDGTAIAPVDRIVAGMMGAADRGEFEMAARWRERFGRATDREHERAGRSRVRGRPPRPTPRTRPSPAPGARRPSRATRPRRSRRLAPRWTPRPDVRRSRFVHLRGSP